MTFQAKEILEKLNSISSIALSQGATDIEIIEFNIFNSSDDIGIIEINIFNSSDDIRIIEINIFNGASSSVSLCKEHGLFQLPPCVPNKPY